MPKIQPIKTISAIHRFKTKNQNDLPFVPQGSKYTFSRVKKHYESPMQDVLRSISNMATKRPDAPAPNILLSGNYKISEPPASVSETRAVFPGLPYYPNGGSGRKLNIIT